MPLQMLEDDMAVSINGKFPLDGDIHMQLASQSHKDVNKSRHQTNSSRWFIDVH